jgi:hypothetical protein
MRTFVSAIGMSALCQKADIGMHQSPARRQGGASEQLRHRIGLRKWCQLYAGEMDQARILVEVLRRQN